MADHFVYDDDPVVPDNQILKPIGTLEEIQKEGLDPRVVPCCHKRVVTADGVQVLGCWWLTHKRCKLAIRGVSGPRRFGTEVIEGKALGGHLIRGVHDCFAIADAKENVEENGGALRIVAEEGEEIDIITTSPDGSVPDAVNPVVGSMNPQRVRVRVKPFPRPGNNPSIAEELLKAEVRIQEEGRARDQQTKKNIGTKPVKA